MQVQVTHHHTDERCILCLAKGDLVRVWVMRDTGSKFHAVSPPMCFHCMAKPHKFRAQQIAPDNMEQKRAAQRRQEKELADLFGGHVQKASGATPWCKGDSRLPFRFLGEAKQTGKKSFTLHRNVLDKLRAECSPGEVPIVSISFINDHSHLEDTWILLPADKINHLT